MSIVPATDDLKDGLIQFVDKLAVKPVEFAYDMTYCENETVAVGSGSVLLSGKCFKMVGSGVESICDSSSVWVIDENAREVVIDIAENGTDNPALLLSGIGTDFKLDSMDTEVYDGKKVLFASFKGSDKEYFSSIKVWYDGSIIVRADVETKDGALFQFNILSLRFLEKDEIQSLNFTVSEERFDSSWVITDLR